MDSISDIRITGIDELRPPRVRKEAYIDFYFKLSHKAPLDWCEDFNALGSKLTPGGAKIDKNQGMVIETWVREMDLIQSHLDKIKHTIKACNQQYLEKMRAQQLAQLAKAAEVSGMGGQQNRLNEIVAQLNFDLD